MPDQKNFKFKCSLIFELAKADFKKRLAGSYFGMLWMFVQPIVTVVIYYMVFTVIGGRGQQQFMDGVPYLLWMICGLVPWFYFSECLSGGTSCLLEYSYLVKKVVFRIDILPMVKIGSALVVHGIFAAILLTVSLFCGNLPQASWLQILYYSGCTAVLALGIVKFTSAAVVFFRDMSQLVAIAIQFGVWLTPVMYSNSQIPWAPVAFILRLNPMYYVAEGYRDSIIRGVWFWEKSETIYFWAVTLLLFWFGNHMFKKLRPHFADVL